jgi:segregation and condensation protein A
MTDTSYQVQLDVFEGPLDLLLHLVKKHELDILDIPISFVTEKYLAYLDAMASLDIDVAAEYLVMAATLCHIKSRELLPGGDGSELDDAEVGEDGEAELDPRADLIRRLLEYQKYKEAATHLGDRPVVGRNVWGRGTSLEDAIAENVDPDAVAPLAHFPVHKLIEALDRLMRQAKVKVSHDVLIDRLSLSQRIAELTDRLEREASFTFTSMFRFARSPDGSLGSQPGVEMTHEEIRHEAVVTFLAILEMAKLRLIAIEQLPEDEEIYIRRSAEELPVDQKIAVNDDYRG